MKYKELPEKLIAINVSHFNFRWLEQMIDLLVFVTLHF